MQNRSLKRIFIVGCPRSGTTLLQSMIAAHPRLTSYPETHFWDYTIPKKGYLRWAKIYSYPERKLVSDYLNEHGYPGEAMSGMRPFYFRTPAWSAALMRVLDSLTSNKFHGWIEKTPRHLHCIPFIEAADPDARFLHMLREGKDVVASMYEVTHSYPEHWNGPRDIDTCIERWKTDIGISRRYLGRQRHAFVRYGDLTERAGDTLKEISEFLGVDYTSEMRRSFKEEARNLVGSSEKWKAANIRGRKKKDKFSGIFNTEEQAYIRESLRDVSLQSFENGILSETPESGEKREAAQ